MSRFLEVLKVKNLRMGQLADCIGQPECSLYNYALFHSYWMLAALNLQAFFVPHSNKDKIDFE